MCALHSERVVGIAAAHMHGLWQLAAGPMPLARNAPCSAGDCRTDCALYLLLAGLVNTMRAAAGEGSQEAGAPVSVLLARDALMVVDGAPMRPDGAVVTS